MAASDDLSHWQRLITGLRSGDEQIATEFYSHYGPLLERLASGHLASGMLRRVGPDDVAHSACRTFMRRIQGGQFTLDAADNLWNLLCAITLAKARKKVRFHLARRREIGREVRPRPEGDESEPRPIDVAGTGPTPEEAAAFTDQFHHLLGDMEDEERQIVLLKLEQKTHEEVATTIGISERTVRRVLKRIEARLVEALEGDV